MKIVLKGILTREDAELAADNGIDGIIVSNHGGPDGPWRGPLEPDMDRVHVVRKWRERRDIDVTTLNPIPKTSAYHSN
jgi:isopentenyl diphosphate isomerase/L-lactate dehydrogenase-like FMN-dependent dehydrogenase